MCMEMQLIAKQDVRFSFFFFHLKVKKVQLKKKFTNNKIIPNTEVPIRGIKNQAKTNASCIPGSEKNWDQHSYLATKRPPEHALKGFIVCSFSSLKKIIFQ